MPSKTEGGLRHTTAFYMPSIVAYLMEAAALEQLVKDIVSMSCALKDKYTDQKDARVNYACVFSHNNEEYEELVRTSHCIGNVIDDTPTGPLFHTKSLETVSGPVKLLKIRKPDKNRPERGNADFTVTQYESFKVICLSKPAFKLIQRPKFEMIELAAKEFDVLAYFSNPPLDEQFGIS